jgi:ribosomal protein S26
MSDNNKTTSGNQMDRKGKGRNKGGGFGTGGFCVCVKCGKKVAHQRGIKCTTLKCPDCGHTMIREELLNN